MAKVYTGLDIGKFIASILVVVLHVHPMADNTNADLFLTAFLLILMNRSHIILLFFSEGPY